ncbi:hypothetical protein [Pseudomonas sp. JAI120]|uniref:hypothetical protein n=1 Tax=Pseudomonas sp. JAI120 TaxID=2723063 RepID=UPI0030D94823
MSNFLLGDSSINFLQGFCSDLDEKTRKKAEELDGRSYPDYTPWLCIRPILNSPIKSDELVNYKFKPGQLITDPNYLSCISEFVCGQGHDLAGGMPVHFSEWPVMEDIKVKRPDAVSAFQEGRALIRSSYFLETLYTTLIKFVVPQDRAKPSGFDSGLARGAVFRTFPSGRTGLLAGFQLAHAMGHQAAIYLQSADPLIEPSHIQKLIHYEVRNDERTAYHAIVSAAAISYMCILSESIYGSKSRPLIADDHVSGYGDDLAESLKKAVCSIRKGAPVTNAGSKVLDEMEELSETC